MYYSNLQWFQGFHFQSFYNWGLGVKISTKKIDELNVQAFMDAYQNCIRTFWLYSKHLSKTDLNAHNPASANKTVNPKNTTALRRTQKLCISFFFFS